VQQYGRKEWSENNNNPPPPISIINKKYNYTTQEEVVHVMMPSIDLWTKKKRGGNATEPGTAQKTPQGEEGLAVEEGSTSNSVIINNKIVMMID